MPVDGLRLMTGVCVRYTGNLLDMGAVLKKHISSPSDIQYGTDASCPVEQAALKKTGL